MMKYLFLSYVKKCLYGGVLFAIVGCGTSSQYARQEGYPVNMRGSNGVWQAQPAYGGGYGQAYAPGVGVNAHGVSLPPPSMRSFANIPEAVDVTNSIGGSDASSNFPQHYPPESYPQHVPYPKQPTYNGFYQPYTPPELVYGGAVNSQPSYRSASERRSYGMPAQQQPPVQYYMPPPTQYSQNHTRGGGISTNTSAQTYRNAGSPDYYADSQVYRQYPHFH